MFSKPESAAACCFCRLLLLSAVSAVATQSVAFAVAARVLIEQLTVSDQQLILLKIVHVSVCAGVWLWK